MELVDGPRPKRAVGAEDGDLLGCMGGLSNACDLPPFPSVHQIDIKNVSLDIGSAPVALGSCLCHLLAPSLSASRALPSRGGDHTCSPRLRVRSHCTLAFA